MDEVVVEETEKVIARTSGQDIGNPNPPSFIMPAHEGHKADADSWLRTKNRKYLKKRARQMVNNGSTDKSILSLLISRRQA